MLPNLTPDELFDRYFLQSVVQHATYLLGGDGSGFYLWDASRNRATLIAKHNLDVIPWESSLPRRTVGMEKALAETFPTRPAVLSVSAPLHQDARGVLVVADWTPHRSFDNQDEATLQSLADLAAAASRQTQRLARMTAQFRALHVIDIALNSSLQLERVLDLILEKAVELVGAEHGSLRQLKPETGELILKTYFGDGWSEEKLAYTPRVGEGIAQWVAEHGRPYLSPDVRKDSRYVVLFEDMRSSVAVPLLYSQTDEPEPDEFLGVLFLESSRLAAFDQQDVELLDALAQEAVMAIKNATQHQKLQSMHERLKGEQEKRLAAEKWTVMGQAATSLAHRINNLIGIVPASAGEIQRTLSGLDLPEGDHQWIDANLGRIERNAKFILKLVEALFRPFKASDPSRPLDVNRLVKEALESADLPASIRVSTVYADNVPNIESSPLLVDSFLELITNAKKAMAESPEKKLSIETRTESRDSQCWVVIEFKDTGCGIPSDRMDHLWDMFQQSKDGLGYGLWWLRTFIVRQGGTIACRSTPGEGSRFTVCLPAATV